MVHNLSLRGRRRRDRGKVGETVRVGMFRHSVIKPLSPRRPPTAHPAQPRAGQGRPFPKKLRGGLARWDVCRQPQRSTTAVIFADSPMIYDRTASPQKIALMGHIAVSVAVCRRIEYRRRSPIDSRSASQQQQWVVDKSERGITNASSQS